MQINRRDYMDFPAESDRHADPLDYRVSMAIEKNTKLVSLARLLCCRCFLAPQRPGRKVPFRQSGNLGNVSAAT